MVNVHLLGSRIRGWAYLSNWDLTLLVFQDEPFKLSVDHEQCFFRGLCILGELDNYLVRGRDQCVFSDVDVCSIEINI